MDYCILVADLVILELNIHGFTFVIFNDGASFDRVLLFFLVVIVLDVLDDHGHRLN